MIKSQIRIKYLKLRKKKYRENINIDYKVVQSLIKQFKKKNPIIGGYFPVNYEIDCINILRKLELNKFKVALPVIKKNNDKKTIRACGGNNRCQALWISHGRR